MMCAKRSSPPTLTLPTKTTQPMAGAKCTAPNLKEIARLIAKWKKKLRLQDWTIHAKVVQQEEMSEPGRWAEVYPFPDRLMAIIYFLDPKSAADNSFPEDDCDLERTVVHELVHVPLYGMGDYNSRFKRHIEETAIERIASALVELDRKAK